MVTAEFLPYLSLIVTQVLTVKLVTVISTVIVRVTHIVESDTQLIVALELPRHTFWNLCNRQINKVKP